MLVGKLATLMKYRLPVKVIIVKYAVLGMIVREQIACVGNPQYGVQSQPIGFEAVAKACEIAGYAVNNPKLVEHGLRGAFNHSGISVVQAIVDLARNIHDGSSRNHAVAKRAVPDERPAPVHVYREGMSYGVHERDLSDYPASHGCIPPTISRCRLNDAWKLFVVIPLSNGPPVHIVGKDLGNWLFKIVAVPKTGLDLSPMVLVTVLSPGALCASTLNDTHQNDHNRDDQERMNESAHGIRGNKTQNPEDDQDDGNGLEHGASPSAIR